jgi:hypothetical protein
LYLARVEGKKAFQKSRFSLNRYRFEGARVGPPPPRAPRGEDFTPFISWEKPEASLAQLSTLLNEAGTDEFKIKIYCSGESADIARTLRNKKIEMTKRMMMIALAGMLPLIYLASAPVSAMTTETIVARSTSKIT